LLAVIPIVLAGLLLAACVNLHGRREFTTRVKRCANAAILSLLAAAVMYVWGGLEDVRLGHRRDLQAKIRPSLGPRYAGDHFFPLSSPCNATFDIVPDYVNPAIIALISASVVLAAVAVVSQRQRRRPH
jgi:VIT1/CCC1 family predicted Fe2+/Mn2+ transporter